MFCASINPLEVFWKALFYRDRDDLRKFIGVHGNDGLFEPGIIPSIALDQEQDLFGCFDRALPYSKLR